MLLNIGNKQSIRMGSTRKIVEGGSGSTPADPLIAVPELMPVFKPTMLVPLTYANFQEPFEASPLKSVALIAASNLVVS